MKTIFAVVSFAYLVSAWPDHARPATRGQGSDKDPRDREPVVAGYNEYIHSDKLGERRLYSIYLPLDYEESELRYPVLYSTDGEWNFLQTAGLVDQLGRWDRIPRMIVVAVHNTNRDRDLTPTVDPYFAGTGGAADFLAFFATELIPHIERNYRTDGYRILTGHSFGGVFVIYTLTQQPELFNAYISAGSSLWLTDYWLVSQMDSLAQSFPPVDRFLYFTAGEGDGGPTLPSNLKLSEVLADRAPKRLEWHYKTTPKENHFSNVPTTLQHGLQTLYPIWGMDVELYEKALAGGVAGVESWLNDRKNRLGRRFALPEFETYVVARKLANKSKFEEAHAVLDILLKRFPKSGQPWFGKGLTFEAQGAREEAATMYTQALRTGRANDEPHRMLHNYQSGLARVSEPN